MKIRDLLGVIDSFAPFELAEDWDNPGLMVGSFDCDVQGVAVCLDAVHEAVIQASDAGCNVLLCHHPLIFRGIKHIYLDSGQGRTIQSAITRGVNIIAAHTNWDKASEGVNVQLTRLLGLKDCESLGDFGLVGTLDADMSANDFANYVKDSWHLSRLDYYPGQEGMISRVALCGGSGSEFWGAAKSSGADVYITADMKYHELIDATREGVNILIADHGEMERASLPALAQKVMNSGIKVLLLDTKALVSPLRL